MNDDCMAEWDLLWRQCNYMTDEPYWWTEDCDMVELFSEAWTIWHGWEDEDWALSLKRAFKKMQPRIKAMKAAVPKKGTQKHFKTTVLSTLNHARTMQDSQAASAPAADCYAWPMTDDCSDQWEAWLDDCFEDDWNDACEKTMQDWYATETIDFK